MPLWHRNPDGDFTSHVESTAVFDFISELQRDNKWITPFQSIQEIDAAIRTKTSQLFRYLLDQRRGLEQTEYTAFKDESPKIRDLLISQPENWEHRLFAEMLCNRVRPAKVKLDSLRRGEVILSMRSLPLQEYFPWTTDRMSSILSIPKALLRAVLTDYPNAMGPIGSNSDLVALQACADKIGEIAQACIRFEEEQRSIRVQRILKPIHALTLPWGGDFLITLDEFVSNFWNQVNTPGIKGQQHLDLVLKPPTNSDEYNERVSRLNVTRITDRDLEFVD